MLIPYHFSQVTVLIWILGNSGLNCHQMFQVSCSKLKCVIGHRCCNCIPDHQDDISLQSSQLLSSHYCPIFRFLWCSLQEWLVAMLSFMKFVMSLRTSWKNDQDQQRWNVWDRSVSCFENEFLCYASIFESFKSSCAANGIPSSF